MFRLSGDHAGQVMEKDEEEEEEQQQLGGARKSHVGLLQAFATGEQLNPGRDGGSSVKSLLQGSSSSSGLICNSAMAMDKSCLEQLTTVGASTLSTDMLRESLEIMAQSKLELISPGASKPTVSDSSASTTSGQNFGGVFFSHLQLAGGPDTVPDQCTLEPTAFRAPLHVSGETWRGGESSDGIVCSAEDVRISKDPQSVAARHRRERISDRIRMLRRVVPVGTKMDTASTLDEVIHYIKLLKLQMQVSVSSSHQIYCNSTNSLQENVIQSSHKKPQCMTHV